MERLAIELQEENLIYIGSPTFQMLLRSLKCIAQRKNTLPEARKKSQACSSFILLQLEYNCKPCISKIVYELMSELNNHL